LASSYIPPHEHSQHKEIGTETFFGANASDGSQAFSGAMDIT